MDSGVNYWDKAIVDTLQYDLPICRRTIQYMVGDAIKITPDYKVAICREWNTGTHTVETDFVAAEAIALDVDAVNRTIHVEVQARSLTNMAWRMYQYGVAISREDKPNEKELVFPYQAIQVLVPPGKRVKHTVVGMHVRDYLGEEITRYVVPVKMLESTSVGTLLFPVYEASKVSLRTDEGKRAVAVAILDVVSELGPNIGGTYAKNIVKAIDARFKLEGRKMDDVEFLTDEELYEGKSFAEYMKQFHGEDTPLKAKLREIEEKGRQEGMLKVAINMVNEGADADYVLRMTGIAVSQYPKLAALYKSLHAGQSGVNSIHLGDM